MALTFTKPHYGSQNILYPESLQGKEAVSEYHLTSGSFDLKSRF